MQVNLVQNKETKLQQKNSVVVATNLKREKIFLDANGNEINPRTKTIIKLAENR